MGLCRNGRWLALLSCLLFAFNGFAQFIPIPVGIGAVAAPVNSYTVVSVASTTIGSSGGSISLLPTNYAGGKLAVIGLSYYVPTGANITDNQSNTWIQTTAYTNVAIGVTFFYCINPTLPTGAANWVISSTSHFAGINIGIYNSSSTPVFGAVSGNAINASGNLQPGSLIPPAGNVMMTVFGSFNGTPAPTVPTGFTPIGLYTTATAEAGGCGYLVQSTSTSQNPTWNSNGTSEAASLIYFH